MYDIKPIEQLETLNFDLYEQKKGTVRKSNDGLLFIVSGALCTEYTHAEMLVIVKGQNWYNEPPVE
jgi:hypothetical protein